MPRSQITYLVLQAIASERASLRETAAKLMTTENAIGVAPYRGSSNLTARIRSAQRQLALPLAYQFQASGTVLFEKAETRTGFVPALALFPCVALTQQLWAGPDNIPIVFHNERSNEGHGLP